MQRQRNALLWQLLLILFINFEICFSSFSARARVFIFVAERIGPLASTSNTKNNTVCSTHAHDILQCNPGPHLNTRESDTRVGALTKNCCCRWLCVARMQNMEMKLLRNWQAATSLDLLSVSPTPACAPFIIHSKYCLCIHVLAV